MIAGEPNGVIAVYATHADADRALTSLLSIDFDPRGITVIGPGYAPSETPPELDRGQAHEIEIAKYWARWGGLIGAGLGLAVIGVPAIAAVVGLGAFAPLLAAVPALTGAGGAIATALVGVGVHDTRAAAYETALRNGKVVIVAHTDDPIEITETRDVMASCGPEHMDVHGLRKLAQKP